MDARDLRKRRRRQAVRDEILEAARAVLLSQGLPGLTLGAVADALQLTKPALYYYFDSKEALVFEMVYSCHERQAEAVAASVARASSGAMALEALIRTAAAHFRDRMDELRLAYLMPQVGSAAVTRYDAQMLARLRPFNEMIYGGVADKIRQDQQAGRIASGVDGRRLAFLAHTAVVGVLTFAGLVEVADDQPLIHPHEAMIEELVRTFTGRLVPSGECGEGHSA